MVSQKVHFYVSHHSSTNTGPFHLLVTTKAKVLGDCDARRAAQLSAAFLPVKQVSHIHTVCLTELDTLLKINNSYIRPDFDPQFFFLEGCDYCHTFYSVKAAERAEIKKILAYGTFFGSF